MHIQQAIKRVVRFEAGAETDLQISTLSSKIWQKVLKIVSVSLHEKLFKEGRFGYCKLFTTTGKEGGYYPRYPTYVISIKSDILSKDLPEFYIGFILIKEKDINSTTSGLFEYSGLYDKPTIYFFISDQQGLDYGFTQTVRERLFKDFKQNTEHPRTLHHEFRHMLDWLSGQKRNRDVFKNYKAGFSDETAPSKGLSKNPDQQYSTYVNQTVEINAMYAEWIMKIFESLQDIGIKADYFKNFGAFWHQYWMPYYTGPDLHKYANRRTVRYLQKRLYKLYSYLKERDNPKPQSRFEARKQAVKYLGQENDSI